MTTPIAQLQFMLEPFLPLLEGGTEDIAINDPHCAWALRAGTWHAIRDADRSTMTRSSI